MTVALSKDGELALPAELRAQLKLLPGDDFEIFVENEDVITLRRVTHPANHGVVDLLLACPYPFEIPAREKDDSKALSL